MKLFFISDIHGNEYALKAALQKADALEVDKIICLGDISGYFTGINEVISLLKGHDVICIKGNHDEFLIDNDLIKKEKSYYPAFFKTKETIENTHSEWLRKLTDHEILQFEDFKLSIYHGGPLNPLEQYIFPDQIEFEKYHVEPTIDLFVFGHTHLQFVVSDHGKVFANPGSIGLPRNGDFRAHAISYDTKTRKYTEYRVPYDINKFNERYLGDDSVNKKFFHNVNFGRSSNKQLNHAENYFLNQELVFKLESSGISIINTRFGVILSDEKDKFLENVLYIAHYNDGMLEMTSNTLLFNWQNEIHINSDDQLKRDRAGFYYCKSFQTIEEFNIDILSTIKKALKIIKKYNNKNVQT